MPGAARGGPDGGGWVFVNNSCETFTSGASGAIATWVHQVARAAKRNGEEVTVVSRGSRGAWQTGGGQIEWEPVWWTGEGMGAGYSRHAARALRIARRVHGRREVGQWSYERKVSTAIAKRSRNGPRRTLVLHNDPEMAVALSRKFTDATVLHLFHNPVLASDRWRRAYRRARVVSLAVSNATARTVEGTYDLAPLSVATLANGVDLEAFAPESEPPAQACVGFLGRTGVEKGLDVLLRACLEIDPSVPYSVQVIGDNHWGSHSEDDYQRELKKLGAALEERSVHVRWLGHVPRSGVPEALRRCTVHVVPSRWQEPFGLTALEAMACGVPVVASATGGLPEVVGGAGILVPAEDPSALASALESLLRDPEEAARLGKLARRRAESFSWDRTWLALEGFAAP